MPRQRRGADDSPEQLYRLLVETVRDYAIFVLDPTGIVRTWNPGAQRFKGYTASEIIGRHFSTFYPQSDIDAGKPAHELEVAAETGRFEDEGWRIRKDGSRFWANVIITALRNDSGELVGFAKVTRDLTIRREGELQAQRLAAEEAARAHAELRAEELKKLYEQLQSQAVELELQQEESQALTEELEQSAESLQTALEQAESATRDAQRSERFTEAIITSIADPMVVVDADWKITYINPAAAALGDGEPGAGAELWSALPQIMGTALESSLREAAASHAPARAEAWLPRLGQWWAAAAYPLAEGGEVIIWRDISQTKRRDEARRYLAEASAVFAASLDYQTTLNEFAHKVVPELADWCSVELADGDGRLKQVIVAHVDPEKEKWARELNERYPSRPDAAVGSANVFRTGKPELYATITDDMLVSSAVDADHLRISREIGITSAMVVPLAAHGKVLGTLSLVTTESRRTYSAEDLELATELGRRAALAVDNALLHQATVEARAAAEQANAAKMQFLAVMSHELRTPLNAIGGYTQLLRMGLRGPVTREQTDDLDRISRSQTALLALINDILNFARLDAGRVSYAISDVSVPVLFDDLEALVLPQLGEKQLTFQRSKIAPSLMVCADREKLRQILLNLLSNAIKFTPSGGVIGLSAETQGDNVAIRVTDTGVGIDAANLQSVFEPFVQLERTLTNTREGSGLGLAISRNLAQAMNGDLTAESTPGVGSTFTLVLPAT
jgi:PAS domain S-box-containing protein